MKPRFNHATHTLYLHESGKKQNPVIIFLHGVGASGLMWESHMRALSNYYCIAPDMPGHGKSVDVEWSALSEMTEYVYDLIQKLPQHKAHVVGLSLGGSITISLLSKHSDVIDHAIVDGAGIIPIKGVTAIKLGVRAISPFIHNSLVIKAVASGVGIQKDDLKNFTRDMKMVSPVSFRRAFCQANDMTLPEGMDKVMTPTLFVAGEREAKETTASNRKLAVLMPNASCRIAPKLSHGWLAQEQNLHIEMVKAWTEDKGIPAVLEKCPGA